MSLVVTFVFFGWKSLVRTENRLGCLNDRCFEPFQNCHAMRDLSWVVPHEEIHMSPMESMPVVALLCRRYATAAHGLCPKPSLVSKRSGTLPQRRRSERMLLNGMYNMRLVGRILSRKVTRDMVFVHRRIGASKTDGLIGFGFQLASILPWPASPPGSAGACPHD